MDKPNLEIQNAFRAVFGTAQGIKVLAMLADFADYYSYVNPDSSPIQLSNIAGRRAMILLIFEKLGLKDSEAITRSLLNIPVEAPEEDQIIEEDEI
jgi:hypothetical protein